MLTGNAIIDLICEYQLNEILWKTKMYACNFKQMNKAHGIYAVWQFVHA